MLASLVIVFREAIEAGLIVGIVLAATRGVRQRGWWVGCGVAARGGHVDLAQRLDGRPRP
jgi:high-affinity iron transporter